MNVQEAATRSGYSAWTISQACNMGVLLATKPRGNRGGWDISDADLAAWVALRRRRGANKPLAEAMKRGIAR